MHELQTANRHLRMVNELSPFLQRIGAQRLLNGWSAALRGDREALRNLRSDCFRAENYMPGKFEESLSLEDERMLRRVVLTLMLEIEPESVSEFTRHFVLGCQ